MTIKSPLKAVLSAPFFFLMYFVITVPVNAQIFNFFPTQTPTPKQGGLIAPTSAQQTPTIAPSQSPTIIQNSYVSVTPSGTSGVTNMPAAPTNTPLPTPTIEGQTLSIAPTGPVNIIPQEGRTGAYVDNATETTIVRDGNLLYIGGIFTEVKYGSGSAVTRNRLAGLDLSNQQVIPWNPSPNNKVDTLAVDENSIYVGGSFTEIQQQQRSYLVSFDKVSGLLTSWVPAPNDEVYALHADANKVWVGGRFTAIAGQNKLRIASFSKPNLVMDQSNLDANGDVFTMAGTETTLYVGGAFTDIGGVERKYIAAIDKATGTVTNWNPQLNNEVRSISIDSNNNIIVSGPFTQINGNEVINYTATIDPSTGEISSLQPVNAQGTPIPGTTLTLTIKVNQAELGFQIPNLADILTFIIRIFFVIAGLLALFYLLMGSLEWVTSGGDEEKTTTARKKIVAAVIGLILIVVVLAVVVTLEQIIFSGKICVGVSCAATIPALVKPL